MTPNQLIDQLQRTLSAKAKSEVSTAEDVGQRRPQPPGENQQSSKRQESQLHARLVVFANPSAMVGAQRAEYAFHAKQRYENLRGRQADYENLLEIFKITPEVDAFEILRRLRAGEDVETLVKHVNDGNLLMQLALAPETRRRYDFPYLMNMPRHILFEGNPYLSSFIYEATFVNPQASSASNTSSTSPNELAKSGTAACSSAHVTPFHAAEMVDPQLGNITCSRWTTVISNNQLLRRLLSLYFLYPQPAAPLVHKDLFFEDMAAGRPRFASPLLVDAVLASACQAHRDMSDRSKLWLPTSLAYKFLAEARRLWDLEPPGDSCLTTIQAALTLSQIYYMDAVDRLGASFLQQACDMSKALGLFDPIHYPSDSQMYKASVFTVWAVFSWSAMVTLYFFKKAMLAKPPVTPLPDPALETQWYPEVWVRYPRSTASIPLYVGWKFFLEARLHAIFNEISNLMYSSSGRRTVLLLNEVYVFKKRLDQWMGLVPEPLRPKNLVFPWHFHLHAQYYHTLIALFQPFAGTTAHCLSADADAEAIPDEILEHAHKMLETLLRLYYLRHSYDMMDPWICHWLNFLGNNTIDRLSGSSQNSSKAVPRETLRSILLLAAKGLESQGNNYLVAKLSCIGLQSRMKPEELQWVRTWLLAETVEDREQEVIANRTQSQYPIPIIRLDGDPDEVRLGAMVRDFEGLNVETESSNHSMIGQGA